MKSRLLVTAIAAGTLFAGAAYAQGTGGSTSGSTASGTAGTSASDMPGSTAAGDTAPGTTGGSRSGGMGSSMGTSTAGDRAGTTGSTGGMASDSGSMSSGSMSSGSASSGSMSSGSASAGSMGGTSSGMAAQMDQDTLRDLQQALKDQGQDIEVDGVWGPNTQQALMEFQQSEGIDATGQPDQETLAALGVESEVGMGGSSAISSPAGSTMSDTSGMSGGSPSEANVPNTGRMMEGTATSPSDTITTPTPGSQTGNTPGSDADRMQPKPGGR